MHASYHARYINPFGEDDALVTGRFTGNSNTGTPPRNEPSGTFLFELALPCFKHRGLT